MKTLIAGSRSIKDKNTVHEILDTVSKVYPITFVISGRAKGIDQLGEEWALNKNLPVEYFIPDWDLYGKRAGFVRNKKMVDTSRMVVVIWDGVSKGSLHTINLARESNKFLILIRYNLSDNSYTLES